MFSEFFREHGQEYVQCLLQHIRISFIVLIIAILIGVIVGTIASRYKIMRTISEAVFSVLRIVPSLAILFLLIPIMGVGTKPATVALVVLAVPPILINTIQGFLNVPADTIEAAKGMGMTSAGIFWNIRLPLAFPMIFTGIRTATVEVISSATIASYIGAGGLGDIIFTGLALLRTDYLVIGGGTVALLSLVTGFILDQIYKRLTRYQRV